MFTFTLQVIDWLVRGQLHYFALFFIYVWFIWASKVLVSRRYRPFTGSTSVSATAVIPVVDEPLELFTEVLERITASAIEQVVVVINGQRNEPLEEVCRKFAPQVTWTWTPTPGKRGAVALGVQQARGDVVVLVDSDTTWTPQTLEELLRPFADPRVGGVTTHQKIICPERHWLTRFADWLEDIRSESSMPAMSVLGHVGCLPGRTIAFRREVLERAMPEFLTERFLGIHLEVSDDRALTNYALRYGWRTVYQRTSVVYTDAPTQVNKFIKQQYRWSKGSQYNTIKMMPWMCRHAPMLALWYSADIIIPLFFSGVVLTACYSLATGHNSVPGVENGVLMWGGAVIGCLLGFAVRQWRHLRKNPREVWFLPVFIGLLMVMMTPIRLWGFARAALDEGWGTRKHSYAGKSHRSRLASVPAIMALALLVTFWWVGIAIEQPDDAAAIAQHGGGVGLMAAGAFVVGGLLVGKTVSSRERSAMAAAMPLYAVGAPAAVHALARAVAGDELPRACGLFRPNVSSTVAAARLFSRKLGSSVDSCLATFRRATTIPLVAPEPSCPGPIARIATPDQPRMGRLRWRRRRLPAHPGPGLFRRRTRPAPAHRLDHAGDGGDGQVRFQCLPGHQDQLQQRDRQHL